MLNKKLHTWHLGAPNTHWWHIFSDYSYYISRVRRRTRALIATHNLLLSQRLVATEAFVSGLEPQDEENYEAK